MPIDELSLRRLLIDDRLTHGQAAVKLGVSIITISRAVRKFGLQAGRGVSHRWQFNAYNSELAYVVGLYLTDGWAIRGGIGFSSTEPALIGRYTKALYSLHLPISEAIPTPDPAHKGTKPTFEVKTYSTLFRNWLVQECQFKTVIPERLQKTTTKAKLMFLAGIIDGDGAVTKDGSILIRTTAKWIHELGDLLDSLQVRHRFRVDRILPSGKPYCAVSIRRSDYRAMGGTCFHPMRAWRIANAKDLRHRSIS